MQCCHNFCNGHEESIPDPKPVIPIPRFFPFFLTPSSLSFAISGEAKLILTFARLGTAHAGKTVFTFYNGYRLAVGND
jgi:hypothetical protein